MDFHKGVEITCGIRHIFASGDRKVGKFLKMLHYFHDIKPWNRKAGADRTASEVYHLDPFKTF